MKTVGEFIESLSHGVYSTARYEVEFILPAGVSPNGTTLIYGDSIVGAIQRVEQSLNHDGRISMLAMAVDLPGRTFETVQSRAHGPKAMYPTGLGTPEMCSMSFLIDGQYGAPSYFAAWAGAVGNEMSGTINYADEYTADIKIYPLSKDGTRLSEYTLEKGWVQEVGKVQLGYQNFNAIGLLPVSFGFHRHHYHPLTH